jgi:protein-tyrosine phosphatase
MLRLLFVCTGNICRSPTVEAVFRRLVEEAGLSHRVEVDSAGMGDHFEGHPPDSRAVAAAQRRGVDLTPLRARGLESGDFERFDLILGMEHAHVLAMRHECPSRFRERIRCFMEWVPGRVTEDLPDPYGSSDPAAFETVLDLAEAGSRALLDEVRGRLRA